MLDTASPVIAIDGPGGAGKGTIARLAALKLNWHMLDSGALYRLVALAAQRHGLAWDNEAALVPLAGHLDVEFLADSGFTESRILLEGEDVTDAIRTEDCGSGASQVAVLPGVRSALLDRQRAFRRPPGLVADGRDMGTVIFPDAELKIFLTASPEERALRRHKQLKQKGIDVNVATLSKEISARDARDAQRSAAPLQAARDAITIDTTAMTIDQVVERVLQLCRDRQLVRV
jgi:cytidylate kinase